MVFSENLKKFTATEFNSFNYLVQYAIELRDSGEINRSRQLLNLIVSPDADSIERSKFELAILDYISGDYFSVIERARSINSSYFNDSLLCLLCSSYYNIKNLELAEKLLTIFLSEKRDLLSKFFAQIIVGVGINILDDSDFEILISSSLDSRGFLGSVFIEWWKIPNIWNISSKTNALEKLTEILAQPNFNTSSSSYFNYLVGLCCARACRDTDFYNKMTPLLVMLLGNESVRQVLNPYSIKALIKVFNSLISRDVEISLLDSARDRYDVDIFSVPLQEFGHRCSILKNEEYTGYGIFKYINSESVQRYNQYISPSDCQLRVCMFGQVRTTYDEIVNLTNSISRLGFKKAVFDISTWNVSGARIPPNIPSLAEQCDESLKDFIYHELLKKDVSVLKYDSKSLFTSNYEVSDIFKFIPSLHNLFIESEVIDYRIQGLFQTALFWNESEFLDLYGSLRNRVNLKVRSYIELERIKNQLKMWFCIGKYINNILNSDVDSDFFLFIRSDLECTGDWNLEKLSRSGVFCDIEPNCLMTGCGGVGDRYFIVPRELLHILAIPYQMMNSSDSSLIEDFNIERLSAHQLIESLFFISGMSFDFTSSHWPFVIKRRLRSVADIVV